MSTSSTEVPSRAAYYELGAKLRSRGFREVHEEGAPICRWTVEGVSTDVIPVDPVSAIAPYGAPPIVVDGGEGAEDAASEASDGQLVDVGAEGGGVADTGTAAAADGATIDAEGDAGGAD